jgi:hypothetical protein
MLKKLERTARKGGDEDEEEREQQQQIADNFTPLNFYAFEQHFSSI